MKKFYLIVAFSIFLSRFSAFAQVTHVDDNQSEGLKGGINYRNNNVFMGRTDTITSKTLSPQLTYTFKSGFYLSGTLNFILNQKKRTIDGSDVEVGYNYDINDDLYAGVSFSKYLYSAGSTRITSAISSIFNAYLNYNILDIITPGINLNYSISTKNVKNDVFINPGIMHNFSIDNVFVNNNELDFDPNMGLNMGTQNFYDGYFLRRRNSIANKQISTEDQAVLAKFTLLDYEASLPIKYKAENYLVSFTPTYAFPQNKLPENITSKLATKSSLLYFEASVLFKF